MPPPPALEPTPVPLADVVAVAENTSEKLREMETDLSAEQTSAMVAREVPLVTHEIAALLDETTRSLKPARRARPWRR